MRRTARTAADGVGATEWLEMGGDKKKEGKGKERLIWKSAAVA